MKKHNIDFRNLVVRLYWNMRSMRRASAIAGVSKSTVHNWVNKHPAARGLVGRKRIASPEVLSFIDARVKEHPLGTVTSVAQAVRDRFGVRVSCSCVRGLIRSVGYTYKQATLRVQKAGLHEQRQAYARLVVPSIRPEEVISIDETSFFFQQTPKRGYSKRGTRLSVNKHYAQRNRLSVLMAVSSNGHSAFKSYSGSVNAALFAQFVRTELSSMAPQCKYLLMDNAAFHKTREVLDACAQVGIKPLFLPPYTPDFQPIEHVFAVVKHRYRTLEPAPTFSAHDFQSRVQQAIQMALTSAGALASRCFGAVWARLEMA